jgi:hypothetical protein
MKKSRIIFSLLAFLFLGSYFFFNVHPSNKGSQELSVINKLPKAERLAFFHQYDIDRTKDPRTGEVPQGIREKVLNFVSGITSRDELFAKENQMAKFGDFSPGIFEWQSVGPVNIGGRMNCVELDFENENIILSGAASGGVWRSIDAGLSWVKTSSLNEIQGVYSIAQDKRPGKSNIWYYGTGELLTTVNRKIMNAARMSYLGNGIYKSTDNGASWFPLKSTQGGTIGKLTDNFQGVWKIIPDKTETNKDIVFAACLGGIMKSTDGGTSWSMVLGDNVNKSFSSDLQMANDGTLYASLSRISTTGKLPEFSGIFKSNDKGNTWTNLTPPDFQQNSKVIKLALAPTSNNTLFALVDYPNNNSFDPYAFQNTSLALWKATNLKVSANWSNITSSKAPPSQEVMNPATLGGYAMVIKVKPDDENTVLIGGTSLYRSKNGFEDNLKYDMIGGYYWNDGGFGYDLSSEYLHPDIHDFVFSPSNPNNFYCASDGGIHYSDNISGLVPVWSQKNDGLITSQFYAVALGQTVSSKNFLLGGLQDNGSFYLENKISDKKWIQASGGDGMHVEIANDMKFIITSWYNGSMIYAALDEDTYEPLWGAYATPSNVPSSNFNFYNVYLLDPVDNKSLYLPAKNKIFFNHALNTIGEDNDGYQNAWNITPPDAYIFPTNEHVTALKISKNSPDILFVGTNAGKVYIIDNINNPTLSSRYEITGNEFPENGWVSCIDYDEQNSKILVTFSNYNIKSIFVSADDGDSWTNIGGNLEENPDGTGAGPSVRWMKTVNLTPAKTYYFVATDVGIFSTDKLDGKNTTWLQEGKSTIGNVIVEMLD